MEDKLPIWWPHIDVQEEVHRLFHQLVHQPWSSRGHADVRDWQPRCDMVETDDSIIVALELPEGRCEDVHVTVEGKMLHIRGRKRCSVQYQGRKYYYRERYAGWFERQLCLPRLVDHQTMRAECTDGVLVVTLLKKNH